MDFIDQYLDRARDIIGDRSADEKKYDAEVLKWLRKGRDIKKAIRKANRMFPKEALTVTDDNLAAVEAHYDYLKTHMSIASKLGLPE
jgi:hypothetical protein